MLTNIILNELNKELERRGHLFVRYADDRLHRAISTEALHRQGYDWIGCYYTPSKLPKG